MLCFVPRPISGEHLALECYSYWIKVIICSWNFVSIMCGGPDVVDVLVWRITKLKVYTWVAELFLLICQASHDSHMICGEDLPFLSWILIIFRFRLLGYMWSRDRSCEWKSQKLLPHLLTVSFFFLLCFWGRKKRGGGGWGRRTAKCICLQSSCHH